MSSISTISHTQCCSLSCLPPSWSNPHQPKSYTSTPKHAIYIHTHTTRYATEPIHQLTPFNAHLWLVKPRLQCLGEVSDDLLTVPPDPRKGLDVLVLVEKGTGLGVVPHCLRICTHVQTLLEAFRQLKEELQLCGCEERERD